MQITIKIIHVKIILKACKKKPISFEVFADNSKDMLKQTYKINSWGKNIYVKIPMTELLKKEFSPDQ